MWCIGCTVDFESIGCGSIPYFPTSPTEFVSSLMGKIHAKGYRIKVLCLSPKQKNREHYLVPLPMHELFKNTEKPYEMVPMDSLKLEVVYDINYCVVQALKKDILENGMLQPLLVGREHMLVHLGNQRYAILKDLGITEVPIRYKNE